MALCPQCRNALPETPPRYCPNCGADLEATTSPAPGATGDVPPAAPAPPPPLPPGGTWTPPPPGGRGPGGAGSPWEERDRLGILAALVETTKRVMGEPTAFFRGMPTQGGIGSPLLYAVLVGWIGIIASGFYSALFQSIVGTSMLPFAHNAELGEMLSFAQSWGGFLFQAVMAPVWITIWAFLLAGIFHVMLLMLGGARRDFEGTFRAVSYAQAPNVLLIVPFCGSLIALVWGLVLYVIGIAEAQQVSRGKAAAAVLLPLVLLCCCCAGVAFLIGGSVAAILQGARQ